MSNNTIKTNERNGRTYAKITDLKIWDKNPREIKPEKLRLLCEDLKRDIDIVENGQFKPLIVMKNGIVIGGNMRLQAMNRLGMTEAWVSVINTTDEKRAFDIATRDNMMYGYYDEDQTAEVIAELGIDIKTLERLSIASENNETILSELVQPEKDPEVEEDEAPEVKEEPKSKLGEVYALGGGRLMCGDSTNAKDVATLMDGALADLWLTDPPYNVAYKGGTSDGLTIQNDDMEDNNFRKFLGDSFAVALQNMRNGAAFYIWHADVNGYTFRAACHDVAIQIRSCLIWNKNQLVLGRQDYQWKHEPCLYGWKDGASHYFRDVRTETTVIDHTKPVDDMNREELEEELLMLRNAIPTTVIDEKRPTKNLEHPTMKPVKLFARLIRNSTKRGDIVLDTFGGSGTTMTACEQTGRIAYIMELDPRYCDVIRRRYWKLKTGVEDGWEEGTRVTNKPVGKIV